MNNSFERQPTGHGRKPFLKKEFLQRPLYQTKIPTKRTKNQPKGADGTKIILAQSHFSSHIQSHILGCYA